MEGLHELCVWAEKRASPTFQHHFGGADFEDIAHTFFYNMEDNA